MAATGHDLNGFSVHHRGSMMTQRRIGVYGALGGLGQRVVEGLARRDMPVVIGGPDERRLQILSQKLEKRGKKSDVAAAPIDAPDELDGMLSGVDVLINCDSPFVDRGKAIVEASIRSTTHYLDISEEQEHICWVSDACDDAARRNNLVLMPGCGLRFGLGDLASEIALANAASRIVVAYAIPGPSLGFGTRKSLTRILTRGGSTFVDGHRVEKRPGIRLFDVPFPDGSSKKGVWVPGGEAITVPRRGGVTTVETCLVSAENSQSFSLPLLRLVPSLLRVFRPSAAGNADSAGSESQERGKPVRDYLVIAFDPKNAAPHVILRGSEPYATTARIVVEAAIRLCEKQPVRTGFIGLADLVEPEEFLDSIEVDICAPK